MLDFSNLKVLVCGDICLDIIEEGEATRLSPEAPVPIVLNPITSYSLGMAGNVALNLKNLGADVTLTTMFVNDEEGLILEKMLKKEGLIRGITKNGLPTDGYTTSKKRIIANNQQIARIDKEIPFDEEGSIDYALIFEEKFSNDKFDLIVISDYNKGLINHESWKILYPVLEKINKGKFFVDTKKTNVLPFYEGMILFPNSKEFSQIKGYNSCMDAHQLLIELDTELLIETASEKGAYVHTKDGSFRYSAYKKEVIDICGCGDTFISSFALYYSKFKNLSRAMKFANYCSSITANKKGTSSIYLNEVINFEQGNL